MLWGLGFGALWTVLLHISSALQINSDAANNALQGWDMLHGNVLLHGWVIGDATYYTFELPLYALAESVAGLGPADMHLVAATAYTVIAALGAAIAACRMPRGDAVARALVVVAVLAAPLSYVEGVALLLEVPDHIGTGAFVMAAVLLVERGAVQRRGAAITFAVALGVLLCLGQLGDATVTYAAVPAVVVVCAWRCLAARRIRTPDAAFALAAGLSVPAEHLLRLVMRSLGGYVMIVPQTGIAPADQWYAHAGIAWQAVLTEFGASAQPLPARVLGVMALVGGGFGFLRVLLWRRGGASRAEQLLSAFIVFNIATYVVSTLPSPQTYREIADVLPCGAVLAALALPRLALPRLALPRLARVGDTVRAVSRWRVFAPVVARRALCVLTVTTIGVVAPLSMAAALPTVPKWNTPLAAWLEDHHLHSGIAGYWQASVITVQSRGKVKVRAVVSAPDRYVGYAWEADTGWYKPKHNYARFVVADPTDSADRLTPADFERRFGQPVSTAKVAGLVVLVYNRNLLKQVGPAIPAEHRIG